MTPLLDGRILTAWGLTQTLCTRGPDVRAQYRTHTLKLPVLILREGLSAAIYHTLPLSEGKRTLLDHLAQHLEQVGLLPDDSTHTLTESARLAEGAQLARLTRETLRALEWHRRFARTQLAEEAPCAS